MYSKMKPEIKRPNEDEEFSTPEGCHILESWNTEQDPSVSIARARVEPGIMTQLHKIAGIVERYLIVQGSGEVQIGDMAPEPVGPGDIIVIPEDTIQQIKNTGREDLIFYCICTPKFTPDQYEALE